jgi:hypothetical protein
MLEAWSGGQTAPEPNLFVLDGDMSLPVAQSRLTDAAHRTDALLVIPDGATARVRMPSDMSSRLTVFQDATDPSPQAVTIRLYQTA